MQELDANQLTLTQMEMARGVEVSEEELDQLLSPGATYLPPTMPPPPREREFRLQEMPASGDLGVYCGGFKTPAKRPRTDLACVVAQGNTSPAAPRQAHHAKLLKVSRQLRADNTVLQVALRLLTVGRTRPVKVARVAALVHNMLVCLRVSLL